jgi:hypothetical protein
MPIGQTLFSEFNGLLVQVKVKACANVRIEINQEVKVKIPFHGPFFDQLPVTKYWEKVGAKRVPTPGGLLVISQPIRKSQGQKTNFIQACFSDELFSVALDRVGLF